jgi:hypothetical protein
MTTVKRTHSSQYQMLPGCCALRNITEAIILLAMIPLTSIAMAQSILPNPNTTPGIADPNLPKKVTCDPSWSTKYVRPAGIGPEAIQS